MSGLSSTRRLLNLGFFACAIRGLSVIAWGGPGVAKSAYNAAAARANGYEFFQFLPSHHIPEDVAGTPVVFREEGVVKMMPYETMQRATMEMFWLMLDEYNTGSAMMRAMLLQLTNERKIGNLTLHPTTIVTAAANPQEFAPNASPLEPAVANRFVHWEWQTPREDVLEGIGNGGKFPDPVMPTFENPDLADLAWGRKVKLFLESKPDMLERMPDADELAFATPRTWTMLLKAMSALDCVHADPDEYGKVAAGTVGKTAGAMFLQFATGLDLFNAKDVLDGKATVDFKAPIDKLCHLPSSLIFHCQTRLREGVLEGDHIDRAFSVLLTMGEGGHIDLVKGPLGTIALLKPDYRVPAQYRQRFGSLMSQIL